jgi:oligoendopeptidase F
VSESEQLSIISESLQESNTLVANIQSRFLFEQRLFERRQERELSVDELCAVTLESEREIYGDAVDADVLQPYAWASIPHFYFAGDPYYNFPYMFGLLFALGLYARYRKDPDEFRTGYDELLASTGEADAATLCARFGIDIRQPAFWRESLDIIRKDIDRFEALVGAGAGPNNGKPAVS